MLNNTYGTHILRSDLEAYYLLLLLLFWSRGVVKYCARDVTRVHARNNEIFAFKMRQSFMVERIKVFPIATIHHSKKNTKKRKCRELLCVRKCELI